QGIPMIGHGDELGRTQRGNNNAYCQDNPVSWIDWRLTGEQRELTAFCRRLLALRAAHPVLRRRRFFLGETVTHAGQPLPDLVWLLPDAREMRARDWQRSDAHSVGVFLNGDAIAEPDSQGRPVIDDSFLLLFNSYWEPVPFRLPGTSYGERWTVCADTAEPEGGRDETEYKAGAEVTVEARSLIVLSRPPRRSE
ncbi:glycogen debranching enzyme, partial [Streptomyces antibioticus]|nr:glycogen debranching enzyme [Streptomyces antibioticus]